MSPPLKGRDLLILPKDPSQDIAYFAEGRIGLDRSDDRRHYVLITFGGLVGVIGLLADLIVKMNRPS